MTVETILDLVTQRCNEVLRIPVSTELKMGYRNMIEACIEQRSQEKKGVVIQLPTGAGKTQCLAVIASSFSLNDHPGILIVTRFKEGANDLASLINSLSRADMCVAHHSSNRLKPDVIRATPVLVITHKAYLNALVARDHGAEPNWDLFTSWQGRRRLTVVDEALDVIVSDRVDLKLVRTACSMVRGMVPEGLNPDLDAILDFENRFQRQDEAAPLKRQLTEGEQAALRSLRLPELRDAISKLDASAFILPHGTKITSEEYRDLQAEVIHRLERLTTLDAHWIYSQKKSQVIHASKLVLPPADEKLVILDATASVDRIYELLCDQLELVTPPSGIRRYTNATLHVSDGHRVGKYFLRQQGVTAWRKVLAQLQKELPSNRKVLVVCHKVIKEALLVFEHHFEKLEFINWGKIDGRNDWADFDTAVILGLPYLDEATPISAYLACAVADGIDTTNLDFERVCKLSPAFVESHIAKSVLQFVNRICTRKIVDPVGNCPHADIYLLAPSGRLSDALLSAVKQGMPGVGVSEWDIGVAKRQPRANRADLRLLKFLKDAESRSYTKTELMKRLGIKPRTFEAASPKMQTKEFEEKLAGMNAVYVCSIGRGKEAYFIKH